jgi:hypothetical protein
MESDQIEGILKLFYDKEQDKNILEYVEMDWTPRTEVYELLKGVDRVRIRFYEVSRTGIGFDFMYTLSLLKDIKKLELLDCGRNKKRIDEILSSGDRIVFQNLQKRLVGSSKTKLDFSRFEEVFIDTIIYKTLNKSGLTDQIVYGSLIKLTVPMPRSLRELDSWRFCKRVVIREERNGLEYDLNEIPGNVIKKHCTVKTYL